MTDKLRKKVIIDCDPGIDDTFALLLALKHLDVRGITTVGGNVGIESTTRNACYVLTLTDNENIPVYKGCNDPLFTTIARAEYIHGVCGLGDFNVPDISKKEEDMHAVDYLIDVFKSENDINLVTLGPLTNIAMAIKKCPDIVENIKEILCMGGSVTTGNVTPLAEFNFYADPEAAKIVFESGIKINMVGLNLCRQNNIVHEDLKLLNENDSKVSDFAKNLLNFSINACGGGAMLCDACTMAWIIDDGIITKSLDMHIDIETRGEFTKGMSVCDYREYVGYDPDKDIGREKFRKFDTKKENARVAMEFERNKFKKLLFDTVKSYR